MNLPPRLVIACSIVVVSLCSANALAQSSLFRFNDMDLRDPHIFVNFLGCRDVTDVPLSGFSVNGEIQNSIQNDGNSDGYLDRSTVVEFLPLDQSLATNLFDSGSANCTAPLASTSCSQITSSAIAGDATLSPNTTCLAAIAGTLRPYALALTSSTAPCFASPIGTVVLDLGGIPAQLTGAQIAATFVANPATSLTNGVLRGFISETDANNTIIPAGFPLVGGMPLSSLLPGGSGNCASHSDKDIKDGVTGWWLYLNFTAPRTAQFFDNFLDGFANGFEP